MNVVRERVTLVNAISSLTGADRRQGARRFLEGLTGDELEYIAEYFGARLVESYPTCPRLTRDELALCIQRYDRAVAGPSTGGCRAHGMMILLEYLSVNHAPQIETALAPAGAA